LQLCQNARISEEASIVSQDTPWWQPDRHRDRRPLLITRNRIVAAIRQYFTAEDFVEADTAALQVSPANETHLHGFATSFWSEGTARQPLYLHTSPEFACKKLLAAGETRLFTLGHVFRNGERGPLHHPEFTMAEWYRVGEPYEVLMRDCAALLQKAARAADTKTLRYRGRSADPFAEPERLTVSDAFARYAELDLMAVIPNGEPNRARFAAAAAAIGVPAGTDDTWSDIFSRVLAARIEPQLGIGRATVLCEYPVTEAALARAKPSDPRVAERFELYACGVELANGFAELTDPTEQRRRFAADMDEKARIYGERYPIDDDFLAALAIMPPASGIAMGVDRLVMLSTGAPHIEHVVWTPVAG
jgi:elongation factor P--(R)-beta-lysine ligase